MLINIKDMKEFFYLINFNDVYVNFGALNLIREEMQESDFSVIL